MATPSTPSKYLAEQKAFWNVDEATSRLGRVDTISRSEREYEVRADRDFAEVFSGVTERIDSDTTILEIGCGVGRLLTRLLQHTTPKLVIGVDISEGMIAHARAALGTRNNVLLTTNSGADLEILDNASIDFAFSNDVFIHVHDIDVMRQYLDEVRRVLKPRGIFKFNVRHLCLAKMFANSPGGLLAKASYKIGLRSPLKKTGAASAGFSGLQYRERDINRLVKDAGLVITSVTIAAGECRDDDDSIIWCVCRLASI